MTNTYVVTIRDDVKKIPTYGVVTTNKDEAYEYLTQYAALHERKIEFQERESGRLVAEGKKDWFFQLMIGYQWKK